jgi:hypothetical protein
MQKWIAEQMKTSINHWRNIFLFNSHICLKYGINHNQFVRKPKTFGHFTTVPKYQKSLESCIIPQITPKFERLIHLSPLQSTNNLHEIRYHVLGVLH